MSRSEDYLDQLLKGITPDKTTDAELKQDISEDNLFSNILDEFAQQSKEESRLKGNTEKKKPNEAYDMFGHEDIFGDDFAADAFSDEAFSDEDFLNEDFVDEDFLKEFEKEMAQLEETPRDGEDFSDARQEEKLPVESETPKEEVFKEDEDVLKILEGLEGIDLGLEEISDSGAQDFDMLEDIPADSGAEWDAENTAIEESTKNGEASPEKEKKNGFLNKLGLLLFGEDEDEDEDDFVLFKKKGAGAEPAELPLTEQGEVTIGVATEADLALFEDYSAVPSQPSKEEEPEKDKKKKKKEKKEKVKKEKKPKPKKEKKPKKPKEPDNTPPLPKKPVFLIFLMTASMMALIILGSDLLGYSNQLSNAKNLYAKQDYSEAFAEISGMEIKEGDMELYNKYHVMAIVSVELEAYESLMSQEFYEMALDCLVRTVGRAEKYRVSAEEFGCIHELNGLEQEAESILQETFAVSKEQALELYAYKNKKDYSTELVKVLREIGLETAADDSRRR